MKREKQKIGWVILLITILIFVLKVTLSPVKETIIFFPLHKEAQFIKAESQLNVTTSKISPYKYNLTYHLYSELDRSAYLRQDIGLLYRNGKLATIIGLKNWKQYSANLNQNDLIKDNDTAFYQAISYHYGEIQENSNITSVQTMSMDSLYVIKSKYSQTFNSFHIPQSELEKEWQDTLKPYIDNQLNAIWNKGMNELDINRHQYNLVIPLTELSTYKHKPLPGFTKRKSEEMIGKLWEGIYKNYLFGIKTEEGTSISPYGSTIPLLLFNRDKTEILVLIITKDFQPIILKQLI
ncbi:hypothetical protein [Heyndrickxia oleronia]|uniref:hypothetical protein n=1 Tax=Heyndrickxia oleronia TaxID=38875 RepID=UPI0015D0D646|nr:hypothetical protein [Heyndrickxia oleronia]MBU5213419.1 hypothetical protein [Heyndrickxia oleronia]NYV64587.1 hypothetical protein [Bacillus sp. Gen3]